MLENMAPNRSVKAFDRDAIHDGNIGLNVDHEAVQVEVDRLLASMTLAEKINELRGLQATPIDGLYYAGGNESLGIPAYKMVDGPRGARTGLATAFPVAIARGATFDAELERRVGQAIGKEVFAKGGNVLLAPTINLLRHPGWGRAQETYSEDPWHMGAMGVAFVSGAQNHVLTSPKHFALNNLELTRFEMSANVDIRTLHEVYLPHFKRCVIEGAAASVMSAYNKVNGVYCGEHQELLTDILRDDWGFTGFVESDWFLGTRSTAPAIQAGMDIEMPAPYRFSDEKLDAALQNGEIDEALITRNARRAIYQKVAFGLAEAQSIGDDVVECDAHVELAREVAEKSFVLLKNESVLPLSTQQKIAVVGDLAAMENLGDRGSSMVSSTEVTPPLAGLKAYSNEMTLQHFSSDADLSSLDEFDVVLVVAGLTYREEGEFIPTQQQDAEDSEFARGGDRRDLRLPLEQEVMIKNVAERAAKTVVLLEGGSAIEVSPWSDVVDGLMMIWYPGREGGHALARVLFGDVDASGRLPVTFPSRISQLMDWDISALDVPHDLFHGYRYLDRSGDKAQFPFGFGLSYTSVSMDGLQVERNEVGFFFNVTLTNTGDRSGVAVPQLYVSCPDSHVLRVAKELKGFGRVEIAAGESVDLEIELLDEEIQYFDPDDGWTLESCLYEFHAGFSADDLILDTAWRFDGEAWEPQ